MEIIGFLLATLVGVSLGLIGSGGSILAIPILVYVLGVNPVLATAYSLFIVGSTALIGGLLNLSQKNTDFKTVLIFGFPSVVTIYITRLWLVPFIPDHLFSIGSFEFTKSIGLMLLFAIVMIFASFSMIKSKTENEVEVENVSLKYNKLMILIEGISVGLLTGLVGAGGGFLIIPSLVIFAKMPIKLAIGTSLFIIALNSLIGFIGDLQGSQIIDWKLLLIFTAFASAGIFIGTFLSKKISGAKLKKSFGWFVLVMAIYIILKETLLKN